MQTGKLDLTGELSIKQGGSYSLPFTFVQSNHLPVNFEGCTAQAQIRRRYSDENETAFAVTFDADRTSGKLTLSLTSAQTAALEAANFVWDLFITFDTGQVWAAMEGTVAVKARVTR